MKIAQLGVALWALHAALFAGMVWFDPVHLLLSGGAGASVVQALAAVGFVMVRLGTQLVGPGMLVGGLVWWGMNTKGVRPQQGTPAQIAP